MGDLLHGGLQMCWFWAYTRHKTVLEPELLQLLLNSSEVQQDNLVMSTVAMVTVICGQSYATDLLEKHQSQDIFQDKG